MIISLLVICWLICGVCGLALMMRDTEDYPDNHWTRPRQAMVIALGPFALVLLLLAVVVGDW